MAIRSDEITSIIKSAIDDFDSGVETRSVGTVVEVGDGIAQIYGLDAALASELLEFPGDVFGLALNLEEETVGAVILGNATAIKEGDTVKTTGRVVEVPVGAALLGRVVDPLGQPLDDKGPIATTATRPVERIAPGVIVRKSVDTPVQTGVKAIDALIPIGRGQRELIIGDRQTGKTAIASTRVRISAVSSSVSWAALVTVATTIPRCALSWRWNWSSTRSSSRARPRSTSRLTSRSVPGRTRSSSSFSTTARRLAVGMAGLSTTGSTSGRPRMSAASARSSRHPSSSSSRRATWKAASA